jgi:hypothetical protein
MARKKSPEVLEEKSRKEPANSSPKEPANGGGGPSNEELVVSFKFPRGRLTEASCAPPVAKADSTERGDDEE